MTEREKNIRKAQRLAAKGLTTVEIGKRLGVTHSCVSKWLNPEQAREYNRRDTANGGNARKRRWERENRAACPNCGRPMQPGSAAPSKRPERCADCWTAEAERKREQIVAGYEAGLTAWQIAEQTGIPRNTVQVEAYRLRVAGRLTAKAPTGAAAHRERAALHQETEPIYACSCGYRGERHGHATAEGRVCPFWSEMEEADRG